LHENLSQGYIVLAKCKQDEINRGTIYKRGINLNFDKAVLETVVVKTNEGEERLIKVRNLWNDEYEWDGDWGYTSSKWTPLLKEELNFDSAVEEKIIFLTVEEFATYFSEVIICKYNENFVYSQITLRHVKNAYSIIKFDIDRLTECNFEITQLDDHYYRKHPEYRYAVSRLILAKKEPSGELTYLLGNIASTKYNNTNVTLTEGSYYAFVLIDWPTKVHDVHFSAYSEDLVEFERVLFNENSHLLPQLFKEYISQCLPPTMIENEEGHLKYQLDFDELALKAEVYVNQTTNKKLRIKKTELNLENCSILNIPLKGADLEFVVEPGKTQLVLVGKSELDGEFKYSYKEKSFTK